MGMPAMKTLLSRIVLICGVLAMGAAPALAQTRSVKANSGTVAIVSGGVEGTYVRIASDLASVLDNGTDLRILPILGKGSVQNIDDILLLKGVDIGIVQSDVLAYVKREQPYSNLPQRVKYITKLYNEELHILAGPGVKDIKDLAGQKVNFDGSGSGTHMTASLIFGTLGITVQPETNDQALALERLRRGEIAAMAYVAGKPTRLFRDLKAEDGLHFLSVPLTPELLETYLPSRLTNAEYQGLVKPDEPVETVAVGAVMAVYGWTKDTERYAKVGRFVDAFFGRFDDFLKAPRHPKWKEVNLSAEIPGWTRFEPAAVWLKQAVPAGKTVAAQR